MYRNELDKACFQHDMTYGDFEDLETVSDKVLIDKAFHIAKNRKYDIYIYIYTYIYIYIYIHISKKILLLWFTNSLIKSKVRFTCR